MFYSAKTYEFEAPRRDRARKSIFSLLNCKLSGPVGPLALSKRAVSVTFVARVRTKLVFRISCFDFPTYLQHFRTPPAPDPTYLQHFLPPGRPGTPRPSEAEPWLAPARPAASPLNPPSARSPHQASVRAISKLEAAASCAR